MRSPAALIGGLCVSLVAGGVCLSATRSAFAIEPQLTQLDCTFTSSASGTWDSTGAQAQVRPESVLEFRFDHIDAGRDTANRTVGALTVPTLMTINDDLVQFIEPPANGEMAITSVVMAPRARRFPASYSRTMFYAYSGPGFTSVPQAEQYYGYCVPSPQ